MGNETRQLRGGAMLMLTALIWGTAFVAQSVGMDYLGPCSRKRPPPLRGRRPSLAGAPPAAFCWEGPPCCSRPACRPLQRERPVF